MKGFEGVDELLDFLFAVDDNVHLNNSIEFKS